MNSGFIQNGHGGGKIEVWTNPTPGAKVTPVYGSLNVYIHPTSLHWLPLRQHILYKLAVTVFTALHDQQPEYLACKLQRHRSVRDFRSSTDVSALTVPRIRTMLADRTFAVAAPAVWNSIPLDIRNCDTLNTFKKKLKTWLFMESLHVQH